MSTLLDEEIAGLFNGQVLSGQIQVDEKDVVFTSVARSGASKSFKQPIANATRVEIVTTRLGLKVSINFKDATFRFIRVNKKHREKFDELAKQLKVEVVERQASIAGAHWGELDVVHGLIELTLDENIVFDIPLNTVSQTVTQSKHEVEMVMATKEAYHRNDDDYQELTMISYFLPSTSSDTPAKDFNEHLKTEHQSLQNNAQEQICKFDDLVFQVPRGRYGIAFYQDYFTMSNKTYSNNIPYEHIKRFMYLNQPNDQKLLVIGLNPPVRQGSTSYPFLLIQLDNGKTIPIPINATEEDRASKWVVELPAVIENTLQNTVPYVFQALTSPKEKKINITVADQKFNPPYHFIHASYKGNEGNLYLLKHTFFYIKKPCVLIRYEDVAEVEFSRVDGVIPTHHFDLIVRFTDKTIKPMEFISISNADFDMLFNYLESKGLNIVNVNVVKSLVGSLSTTSSTTTMLDDDDMVPWPILDDDDDDEDDEDFVDEGDDSSSDFSDDESDSGSKHKKRRSKKEKKEKKSRKEKKEKKSKKDKKDRKEKKEKSRDKDDDSSSKKRKRSKDDVDGAPTSDTEGEGSSSTAAVHETKKQRAEAESTTDSPASTTATVDAEIEPADESAD